MKFRRALGRQFEWLWTAYAVSTYGTWFAFGAFSVVAITVLHEGPVAVAALTSGGLAVGAIMALPLGPWVEFRSKRAVMVTSDVIRFAALMSLPIAYIGEVLTFAQLIGVSVVVTASRIAFDAASAPLVKALVGPDDLVIANSRFESTRWSATIVGPTLGGALIGLFGPLVTICTDAISYLLSATGLLAMGDSQVPTATRTTTMSRMSDLLDGWRIIFGHNVLRRLFMNTMLVNGLIMAGEPLLAVLMLGHLGFPAWQYGLAFSVPCIGGLIGSRLARRAVDRFGQSRVLVTAGVLRACWPIGLVLVRPGVSGLVIVILVELGLILCCSLFNPIYVTYRQQHTAAEQLSRVVTAWSISSSLCIAALTALGGVLAVLSSPRTALAVAGIALLLTPLLLLGLPKDPSATRDQRRIDVTTRS